MMTLIRLSSFIFCNPKIQLKKGVVARKVDMDKLVPFTRKVTGFERAPFTGGSKFANKDTLLARITPCLENGKTAFVDILKEGEIAFGSTEFIILRAKENISNPLFVYYFAISPQFREKAISLMTGTSGRQRVDVNALKQLSFDLPPLDEQKRIAEFLGAFDDKIELLQKQNKTLEEMAKATFKSWFVDFDVVKAKQRGDAKADVMREYHLTEELYDLFPSSFTDSSLGPIPLGWEVKSLENVCKRCQSGGTPSTRYAEYWENGDIPWFSTKELQDTFLINSEKNITSQGLDNSAAKLFPQGTIVMAIYASPTVGRLGILTQESTFNQAAVGFVANEDVISKEYLFLLLKHRRDDLNNLANGAAQQNLSVGIVKAFNILIPNSALNAKLKPILTPYFNKIEFNTKQIQTLTEFRDSLLPRLISGKIRV